MESKKNPSHDVHRKSFQFFCLGLLISLGLVITAFEWTTTKQIHPPRQPDEHVPDIVWIIPTTHQEPEAPSPSPKAELKPKPIAVTLEAFNHAETDQPELPFTIDPESFSAPTELPLQPEDVDTIHVFPEQQPEPVFGFNALYHMLAKKLNYPKAAQRQRIEGKVFIEFIIDRTGVPGNMKVLKGIGGGCDEEAMRVLALTQWKPGKQRGKPVKVKMVLPIIFQLRD